jgi:hypothetical protein
MAENRNNYQALAMIYLLARHIRAKALLSLSADPSLKAGVNNFSCCFNPCLPVCRANGTGRWIKTRSSCLCVSLSACGHAQAGARRQVARGELLRFFSVFFVVISYF